MLKITSKKYRTDSYLIEGWHLFEEAVRNHAKIRRVFVETLLDRVRTIRSHYRDSGDLKPLGRFEDSSRDCRRDSSRAARASGSAARAIPLFGGCTGSQHVGTMIRTADAAGFDGHAIGLRWSYSLKTLRSMQGGAFPYSYPGNWIEKNY